MGTKSINVSEEAYERLKTWKQSDEESFTSVILRVLPKRKSILESYREFQRSGKTISDEDADQLIKDLE